MTAINDQLQERQTQQALTAVYALLLNKARENRAKQAEQQATTQPGAGETESAIQGKEQASC